MAKPLVLNGPPSGGKSTVGELAARLGGVRFVDLHPPAAASGTVSGPQLCEAAGREREQLEVLLRSGEALVIGLGPETLLFRSDRLRALEQGVVVSLLASPSALAARAGASPERGQSGGESARSSTECLARLLEGRVAAYGEAHARLDTEALGAKGAAGRALEVWHRDAVAVAAGSRSYAVEIGHALAPARVAELVDGSSQVLLVTDGNVHPLHGAPIEAAVQAAGAGLTTVALEPGEQHKNLRALEQIYVAALRAGADRSSLVVGLGGGVVTDVAGFAAATWMRGVRWAALPTTLLAMVDASVGGKTAVDLLTAKNAVGAFWQPCGVCCDVDFLATESARGYTSALAEVVKTALIGDPELLVLLEDGLDAVRSRDRKTVAELVRRSIRVKAHVVSRDERESGLRACLNLGHTVGHALESGGGYTQLTHGEAVSLGLVAALQIGERLGRTPAALTRRTSGLLEALGLPVRPPPGALQEASRLVGHDKKRAGTELRFVVAEAAGRVTPVRLDLTELRAHVLAIAEHEA
jgi:shikimate kinase/3-dehydroquinate synthase